MLKPRHVRRFLNNKEARRFKFDMHIQKIEGLPNLSGPLVVQWKKDPKQQTTHPTTNLTAGGSVALFDETISLICTLYYNKSGLPEKKKSYVHMFEGKKDLKCVGEIDLSQHAELLVTHGQKPAMRVPIVFNKSSAIKKSCTAYMTCVVRSTWVKGKSGDTGSDASSWLTYDTSSSQGADPTDKLDKRIEEDFGGSSLGAITEGPSGEAGTPRSPIAAVPRPTTAPNPGTGANEPRQAISMPPAGTSYIPPKSSGSDGTFFGSATSSVLSPPAVNTSTTVKSPDVHHTTSRVPDEPVPMPSSPPSSASVVAEVSMLSSQLSSVMVEKESLQRSLNESNLALSQAKQEINVLRVENESFREQIQMKDRAVASNSNDKRQMDELVTQLQRDLAQTFESRQAVGRQLGEVQRQFQEAQYACEMERNKAVDIQRKHELLMNEFKLLKGHFEKYRAETTQQRENLVSEMESLEKARADAEAKLTTMGGGVGGAAADTKRRYESEIDALKAQIERINSNKDAAINDAVRDLRAENDRLANALNISEKKTKAMASAETSGNETILHQLSELRQMNERLVREKDDGLADALVKLYRIKSDYDKKLLHKDEKIKKMNDKLNAFAQNQSIIQTLREEKDGLELRVEQLERESGQSQSDFAGGTQKKQEVTSAESLTENLENQMLMEQLQEMQQELEDMENESRTSREELLNSLEENKKLKTQISNGEARLNLLESDNNDLTRKNQLLSTQLSLESTSVADVKISYERQIESSMEELNQTRMEMERLRSEVYKLSTRGTADQDSAELSKENQLLKQKVAELENRAESSRLRMEFSTVVNEKSQLQAELANQKVKAETLQKEIDDTYARLEKIRSDNATAIREKDEKISALETKMREVEDGAMNEKYTKALDTKNAGKVSAAYSELDRLLEEKLEMQKRLSILRSEVEQEEMLMNKIEEQKQGLENDVHSLQKKVATAGIKSERNRGSSFGSDAGGDNGAYLQELIETKVQLAQAEAQTTMYANVADQFQEKCLKLEERNNAFAEAMSALEVQLVDSKVSAADMEYRVNELEIQNRDLQKTGGAGRMQELEILNQNLKDTVEELEEKLANTISLLKTNAQLTGGR